MWVFSIIQCHMIFRNHSNMLLKKHFWLLAMLKTVIFLWKRDAYHSKVWGEQVIYLLIMLLFFKDALKCSIMTFIMLQKRLFKQMLLNFLYLKHLWKLKCTHKNMKQQKLFILIRNINSYYAILSSVGTMLWQYPKLLRNNIENIIFVTFLILTLSKNTSCLSEVAWCIPWCIASDRSLLINTE